MEGDGTELIVVELRNGYNKPVLYYCFYHPDTAPKPLFELNSSLQENCESTCLILLGDLNFPELDQSSDPSALINTGWRKDHNTFYNLIGDNFFQQFIPGPTHISGNKLHLLLSNWPEEIGSVSNSHPRDSRFPSIIVVSFMIKLRFKWSKGAKRQVYDFRNGILNDLREALTRTPFEIAASEEINEYWWKWKALFLTAVKDYAAMKTIYSWYQLVALD